MRKARMIIEVRNCRLCPMHQPAPNDKSELVPFCVVKERLIGSSLDTIPNWCPFLVEAQEGDSDEV